MNIAILFTSSDFPYKWYAVPDHIEMIASFYADEKYCNVKDCTYCTIKQLCLAGF